MQCPKCEGVMKERTREGIEIDVCGSCRGIFLDKGELEKFIEMAEQGPDDDDDDDDGGGRRGRGREGGIRGFFADLFD